MHQLECLVNSIHFRNSKRYPAFLRFVVEQTLLGRTDCLKERTLGVEVFGRNADYDTNTDPVVRVTAGEIRKRIAQYYQSLDHEQELRIELPLGSYIPHFLPPHSALPLDSHRGEEHAAPLAVVLPPPAILDSPVPMAVAHTESSVEAAGTPALTGFAFTAMPRPSRRVQAALLLGVLSLLILGGAATLLERRHQEAGLSFIWGPLLRSKEQATIVLGVHSFDMNGRDLSPATYASLPLGQQTALASMIRSDMVPVSDVISYSEIVSLLARNTMSFRTQSAAETNIEQFRHGPLILIGGFDNMWTMRLASSLRFRLVAINETLHEIQDSEHPGTRWRFDNAQSALSVTRDYAIVARFFDPQMEQHVLVIAGIGKSGTEAAADFMTDSKALKSWMDASPKGGDDNVEIVLSTDIIEGKHGPPHVVAGYRW